MHPAKSPLLLCLLFSAPGRTASSTLVTQHARVRSRIAQSRQSSRLTWRPGGRRCRCGRRDLWHSSAPPCSRAVVGATRGLAQRASSDRHVCELASRPALLAAARAEASWAPSIYAPSSHVWKELSRVSRPSSTVMLTSSCVAGRQRQGRKKVSGMNAVQSSRSSGRTTAMACSLGSGRWQRLVPLPHPSPRMHSLHCSVPKHHPAVRTALPSFPPRCAAACGPHPPPPGPSARRQPPRQWGHHPPAQLSNK